jgi:hypothetical protein
MPNPQDQRSPVSRKTLVMIVAAFVVVLLFLTWAPWNPQHVGFNPGPSGTPGSTVVEDTPPPNASPSGGTATTGAGR